MTIRAVLDTSALVPAQQRHHLQQLAMSEVGLYTGIWSPWIIAELNRVLTWRWIKDPPPGRVRNDLSDANERRCAQAAKSMMEVLLATFRPRAAAPARRPAAPASRLYADGPRYSPLQPTFLPPSS